MFSLVKFFKILSIVFPILVLVSILIAKMIGIESINDKDVIGYFLIIEIIFVGMGKILELKEKDVHR